jgi:PAS domain S-box-containing protein
MTGIEFKKIEKNQLDEIFDSIPSGLLSLSRDGRIIELNKYAECTIGKVRNDILDKNFESLLSDDTTEVFRDFLNEVFLSGRNEFCEVTINNEDSFPVYALLIGRVPHDRDDCFITMIDISSHHNKLEILEESNTRFQNYSNHVSAFIAYINADTLKYEYVNELYSKYFAIPRDKMIGCHVKDLIGEKHYSYVVNYMNKVKSGESVSYENRHIIDSRERWFKVNYSPVFDSERRVTSIAVLIYDMNDLKTALEESNKKIDQISLLNSELENYVNANEELKSITYKCTHQLKEPIRAISNFVQVIKEDYSDSMDEKELGYLNVIKASAARMYLLIDSLFDYSKIDFQKTRSESEIGPIINTALTDLRELIKSSGVRIEVKAMPRLNVYDVELRQLFQNLISNAIKFHKKGQTPVVVIDSELADGAWRFSVRDNGIGIAAENFDTIFDLFHRLPSDEENYAGIGIGLSYCRKIALMHGGRIWVESEPGEGSTFYFTIPVFANGADTRS